MDHRIRCMWSGHFSHTIKVSLVLSLIGLAMGGCKTEPTPEERERTLTARAIALEEEVTKANSVGPGQSEAFNRLVADVEAHNKSTGRFNLSVERAAFGTPPSGQPAYSSSALSHESGNRSCSSCPIFPPNRPKGYFCLLDSRICDPITKNTVCSYRCVKHPF